MRYAVGLPNVGEFGDPALLVELAVAAERHGWDGVYVWDHVLYREPDWPVANPTVVTAAIAARTSRVRLGTLMTALPRRRVQVVAREIATLQALSGGRLVFGAALGSMDSEYAAFGEPAQLRTRAEKLDESLDVLAQLWSGREVRYAGRHVTVDGVQMVPPVREPGVVLERGDRAVPQPGDCVEPVPERGDRAAPRRGDRVETAPERESGDRAVPVSGDRAVRGDRGVGVPVWCGGRWPATAGFRRAARWDGVVPTHADYGKGATMPPPALRAVLDVVAAERGGLDGFDVALEGRTTPGDAASVVSSYAEVGLTWWIEAMGWWRGGVAGAAERIAAGPYG
ncbi:MAG: LLM class flavin-dependent oxidoreductase [Micromonosporaceae bacterium]